MSMEEKPSPRDAAWDVSFGIAETMLTPADLAKITPSPGFFF